MVQIIEENRKPSTGEKFAQAFGGLANLASQYGQNRQQQQQMQQQNETIKNLTGMDVSGLDSKQRELVLGEMLKQQGKNQRLGQTQDFLGQIFGKQSQKNPNEMQGEGEMLQGFNPSNLSDADIAQAASMDPNLGRILQQQKDVGLRERSEERKLGFEKEKLERHESAEITKPLFIELNAARKNIPLQEQAIEDIQNAAADVNGQDYIADVLGFEPMRTAEGAKLKTAIKDFFLSDLSRAGARPNMFIEMQLADALPRVGRSADANLITAEGLKFKVDLAKKRIELIDDISESDRKKYGYVKADVDSRASKLMKPFVEQRKKELEENIRSIKNTYKDNETVPRGYVRMKNPETGEIYDILKGHSKEALKAGWEKQ